MEIFHGTRHRFEQFDLSYIGTGELSPKSAINACWFTESFVGAKHHAIYRVRADKQPLVYRCELTSKAVILDSRRPLSEQPELQKLLFKNLPVSLTASLDHNRNWSSIYQPIYKKTDKNETYLYSPPLKIPENDAIDMYKSCGIHGVYDWEGQFTEEYMHGLTILMFNFSELKILEVIEV